PVQPAPRGAVHAAVGGGDRRVPERVQAPRLADVSAHAARRRHRRRLRPARESIESTESARPAPPALTYARRMGGTVDPETGQTVWEMHVPLDEQLAFSSTATANR